MKAHIDRNGTLSISPEGDAEEFWMLHHARKAAHISLKNERVFREGVKLTFSQEEIPCDRITHVTIFTNGNVMVFNHLGQQMPEYQGPLERVERNIILQILEQKTLPEIRRNVEWSHDHAEI